MVCLLMMLIAMSSMAEEQIDLIGGFGMDNAVKLTDEHFSKVISGYYQNKGKRVKDKQSEGWYTFEVTNDGTCVVRVKEYDGLACQFVMRDYQGNKIGRYEGF